jgi:hypothetical protein
VAFALSGALLSATLAVIGLFFSTVGIETWHQWNRQTVLYSSQVDRSALFVQSCIWFGAFLGWLFNLRLWWRASEYVKTGHSRRFTSMIILLSKDLLHLRHGRWIYRISLVAVFLALPAAGLRFRGESDHHSHLGPSATEKMMIKTLSQDILNNPSTNVFLVTKLSGKKPIWHNRCPSTCDGIYITM